jgi:hypothetical protein
MRQLPGPNAATNEIGTDLALSAVVRPTQGRSRLFPNPPVGCLGAASRERPSGGWTATATLALVLARMPTGSKHLTPSGSPAGPADLSEASRRASLGRSQLGDVLVAVACSPEATAREQGYTYVLTSCASAGLLNGSLLTAIDPENGY